MSVCWYVFLSVCNFWLLFYPTRSIYLRPQRFKQFWIAVNTSICAHIVLILSISVYLFLHKEDTKRPEFAGFKWTRLELARIS